MQTYSTINFSCVIIIGHLSSFFTSIHKNKLEIYYFFIITNLFKKDWHSRDHNNSSGVYSVVKKEFGHKTTLFSVITIQHPTEESYSEEVIKIA